MKLIVLLFNLPSLFLFVRPGQQHVTSRQTKAGAYKIHYEAKNWTASKRRCESEGQILAEIKTRDELDAVLYELNITERSSHDSDYNNWYWIGLTDNATEGSWKWAHSEEVFNNEKSVLKWSSNEPNGGSNENCAEFTVLEPPNSVRDVSCDQRKYSICGKFPNMTCYNDPTYLKKPLDRCYYANGFECADEHRQSQGSRLVPDAFCQFKQYEKAVSWKINSEESQGAIYFGEKDNECQQSCNTFEQICCEEQKLEWKHTDMITEETSKDSENVITTKQHMEKTTEHETTKNKVTVSSLALPEVSEMSVISKLTSNSSITLQTIKITTAKMVNSDLTEGTHSELSSSPPTTPSTIKTTTTTTTTTSPGSTTPPFPLSETEQVVATVIQTLGCTFILVCLAVTIGAYLFLRDFSYERFLHMNMEIALFIAHILVLTMRDKTTNPVPCKLAGAGFQFFFLASFSFMMLEALQAYTIATSVIPFGGYCSRLQYFIVGWSIPSIITVLSVALMHKDYISFWSCWLNLGSSVHYATVCPVLIMSAATIVMAEATGMGNYRPLPNRDRNQATAAVANSKALFLIVPVSTASWFVGMFAVYYQDIALYSVVHGLNVALGISIFVFHSLGNPKVHAIFKKFLPKCC